LKSLNKKLYNFFRIERKKLSATNAFFEYKKITIVALQSGNTFYFEPENVKSIRRLPTHFYEEPKSLTSPFNSPGIRGVRDLQRGN